VTGPEGFPPEDQPDGRPTNRTARFAWGAVAVLLVGVIALVIYALSGSPAPPGVVHRSATSAEVLAEVTRVPASVFDAVGVSAPGTRLAVPTVVHGQPALGAAGRPEVLYVGAEFCPFCGAERWPLVVALSRFGRFTRLDNVQSAPNSVFAGIQSFTFVGSSYTSRYLTFTGLEVYSDSVDASGAFTRIASPTPAQAALLARYGGAGAGSPGSYPLVDIDNAMVASTSGFSPAVLLHQSQAAIAGSLAQAGERPTPTAPGSPPAPTGDATGRAIVASANYLTAGICEVTGQRPGRVCGSRGVRVARAALGLG
jgi:hypothetical protein